uniref:CCHC-type domain-containing protein n=1 Tax=Chromera velia CCMP2878 TaxID=1169474 RepID=A0A0G4HSP8_9ALVE|eukprot:Cvel_8310.t1-p1 / transcript=Cvel_8310.t1 / gene=Cvel_8310 / organism=Chromera_velia_CCMP2878 / gene_product=hypothetical protein / transcript_product=hypothetical protein / location=Cvel_scaffold456:42104-43642(-) / protein_length=392 / sequence_SO=supercontig / SO=protein_coding / is_pseudo=false
MNCLQRPCRECGEEGHLEVECRNRNRYSALEDWEAALGFEASREEEREAIGEEHFIEEDLEGDALDEEEEGDEGGDAGDGDVEFETKERRVDPLPPTGKVVYDDAYRKAIQEDKAKREKAQREQEAFIDASSEAVKSLLVKNAKLALQFGKQLTPEHLLKLFKDILKKAVSYGHPALDGIVLAAAGIDKPKQTCNICIEYKPALDRKALPKFVLANDLWTGEAPGCLKDLTLVERMLIARYHIRQVILKLDMAGRDPTRLPSDQLHNPEDTRQSGIVGHVCIVPHEVVSTFQGIAWSLRERLENLEENFRLKVIFSSPTRQMPSMREVEHVNVGFRPMKVLRAMHWLLHHNVIYQDLTIDYGAFESEWEDVYYNEEAFVIPAFVKRMIEESI